MTTPLALFGSVLLVTWVIILGNLGLVLSHLTLILAHAL